MKKSRGFVHLAALTALFAVGNSLLRYPWRVESSEILLRFCLSAAGAVIPAFVCYPLFQKLYRSRLSGHPFKCAVAAIFAFLLTGYAALVAWQALADYTSYVGEMILTDSHTWLFAAVFLAVAAWLACIPKKSVGVFALVSFAGVALCVLILFACGIPHFRAENLSVTLPASTKGVSSAFPSLLWESVLPIALLSAYFALAVPKKGGRALAIGAGVGYGLLLLCVVQSVLTFGADYASELAYPYSYAVRIISIGPYFFRLEGFSYLLDFSACLVRIGISFAAARRLAERFLPRIGRYLPPILSLLLFFIFLLY